MSLVSLLIALLVIGLILWVVETLIPMDATIKRIIQTVVVVAVIIWLVRGFLPGVAV